MGIGSWKAIEAIDTFPRWQTPANNERQQRAPTTSANNERQQSLRSYTSTQAFAESALLHVNIDWFEWVKPNGNGNEMGLLWVQIGEFHRILARLGPRLQTLSRFIFAFRRIFAKFGQNGRLPMGLVWNGVGDRWNRWNGWVLRSPI